MEAPARRPVPDPPEHISAILMRLLEGQDLSPQAREAVREGLGFVPHRECSCVECFRAFELVP